MPGIARALADNACYHLINRGNGRQQVFHKDGDYRAFIDIMHQAREKGRTMGVENHGGRV